MFLICKILIGFPFMFSVPLLQTSLWDWRHTCFTWIKRWEGTLSATVIMQFILPLQLKFNNYNYIFKNISKTRFLWGPTWIIKPHVHKNMCCLHLSDARNPLFIVIIQHSSVVATGRFGEKTDTIITNVKNVM